MTARPNCTASIRDLGIVAPAFFVPCRASEVKRCERSISAMASKIGSETGRMFTVRVIKHLGVDGVGVWRLQ